MTEQARFTTQDGYKIYCRYDELIPLDQFEPHPDNPNTHPEKQLKILGDVYKKNGIRQPIKVSKLSGYVISGHGRLAAAKLAGLSVFPVEYQNYKDKKAEMADLLSDNKIAELSVIDNDILKQAIDDAGLNKIDLQDMGFTPEELENLLKTAADSAEADEEEKGYNEPETNKLSDLFLVPPFSVLNANAEYWTDRKSEWESLGFNSANSRIDYPTDDIVLYEILYTWFSRAGDKVVDPFPGGSIREGVAYTLGRTTGEQAVYDFCLSCPDEIIKKPYVDFITEYREKVKNLYNQMADNRFVAIVMGEVRGETGNYNNFLGDTITAFLSAGFNYYNEIVVQKPFEAAEEKLNIFRKERKVCKIHYNVLVFVKGDGMKASERLGDIAIADLISDDVE